MSTDPRFLEAWVNRAGHRVFGRKLHPLCFLDMLALEAVESPFLPGSLADPKEADFHLAIHLLSQPIRSLEISDRIAELPWWRRFVYARYDLGKANAQLQSYFNDYFTTLEMWRADDVGKSCQAPWILSQVTFLLQHTNLSERDIWTRPIGQMMCYASALEEQLSSSQVISPEEQEAMQELRERAKEANHNGRS